MKNQEFRSSDYQLSVTLLTLQEELLFIEKEENSKRATFVFKDSPTLHKRIKKFRSGKLLVEPQALFTQHRALKSRIYNDN